jgi:hypothetical protein
MRSRDPGIRSRAGPARGRSARLELYFGPGLRVDVRQVSRHRVDTDEQAPGDLRIGRALDDQSQNLALAGGQLRETGGHARAQTDERKERLERVITRRPIRRLTRDQTCAGYARRELPTPIVARERVGPVVQNQGRCPHLSEPIGEVAIGVRCAQRRRRRHGTYEHVGRCGAT